MTPEQQLREALETLISCAEAHAFVHKSGELMHDCERAKAALALPVGQDGVEETEILTIMQDVFVANYKELYWKKAQDAHNKAIEAVYEAIRPYLRAKPEVVVDDLKKQNAELIKALENANAFGGAVVERQPIKADLEKCAKAVMNRCMFTAVWPDTEEGSKIVARAVISAIEGGCL